jgi:hypothetical protein
VKTNAWLAFENHHHHVPSCVGEDNAHIALQALLSNAVLTASVKMTLKIANEKNK